MYKYFQKSTKTKLILIIIILLIAFALRLYCSGLLLSGADINLYKDWGKRGLEKGLHNINSNPEFCSYPPLYLYIIYVISLINSFLNTKNLFDLMIILPPVISDLICALLLFYFFSKKESFKKSILIFSLYLFNPFIIFNSSIYGRCDSIALLLFFLSVIMTVKKKNIPACIFLALSILTKVEYAIYIPFIFTFYKKEEHTWLEQITKAASTCLITVFIFSLLHICYKAFDSLVSVVFYNFRLPLELTLHNFNIWTLLSGGELTLPLNTMIWGIITYKNLSFIFLFSLFLFIFIYFLKEKNEETLILSLGGTAFLFFFFFSYNTVSYIYPVLLLLSLLFYKNTKYKILYGLISINLFLSIFLTWKYYPSVSAGTAVVISIINLIILFIYIWPILKKYKTKLLILITSLTVIAVLSNINTLRKEEIYLSHMKELVATQEWGKMGKDKNLEDNRLFISSYPYDYGISTHANSTIIYDLNKKYSYFKSDIGLSKKVGGKGSVIFKVYLDDELYYESDIICGREKPKHIEIPLCDVKYLKLVVEDGGDGKNYDHAIWGNAKLYK